MVKRGEIRWADLGPPRGSGPAFDRPVLIVQADSFNQSSLHTVVVVPLTTNLRLASSPGNVFLPAKETGLPKDSVANVSLLTSIDKGTLREFCGEVGTSLMFRVEDGIRLVLGLGGGLASGVASIEEMRGTYKVRSKFARGKTGRRKKK